MDGFTLIVSSENEEKTYKRIIDMPTESKVERVAVLVLSNSESSYQLPTVLTGSRTYHGEQAVKSFLFHL